MKIIKPLTLQIESKLWEEWKRSVPRDITLNKALVGLIQDDMNFKEDHKKRGKKK